MTEIGSPEAAYEEWRQPGAWRVGELKAFSAGWQAKTADDAKDHDGEITNERIYEDLKRYQDLGVIDYVLPTDPLGVQWIIGVRGEIQKLIGKGQAVAWLVGAGSVAKVLAERAGLTLEGRS
jgi:hypothetical protein